MKDTDLDKIERDIEAGKYWLGGLEKLPHWVQCELSRRVAEREYKIARSKIDYESRDWSKPIDFQDCYITGIQGEAMAFVSHLTVGSNEEAVSIGMIIQFGLHRYEAFRTKEKLDGFIETLIQARDAVFEE